MYTLEAIKDDVLKDYPQVQEWLDIAKFNILKKEINEDKLEFFYSYGYFLPKVNDEIKEEFYMNMYESIHNMRFEKRLAFEFSKIRVNLTMKVGNFVLSNRMPKGQLPKIILDIVTEITKVKMTIESEMHDNQEVIDSIPEIDKSIVSFEIIRDAVKEEYKSVDFSLDSILDKISANGIDSLSPEEKEFLDKKSKEE